MSDSIGILLLVLSYVTVLAIGYILGYKCPFVPKFGSVVIEKSDDPKQNDKVSFVFSKNLDELYSAKVIKLSVVHTKREKSNSDNDEN